MIYRKKIVAFAGAAGVLFGASTALSQGTTTVACNDTSVLPNPVFMAGSSAFEPILSQLAVQSQRSRGFPSSMILFPPASACPRFLPLRTIPRRNRFRHCPLLHSRPHR